MLKCFLLILLIEITFGNEFEFDEKGNMQKPLNFLKLVASKVTGEEKTTEKPDLHTENAKAELKVLKGLHQRLLESEDPQEKLELKQLIMEKVDKIERLLHKKKR